MKRTFLIAVASLLCVFGVVLSAQDAYFNNVPYRIDTIALYPAGPGTTYLQVRLNNLQSPTASLDAYLLIADTRNEYVTIEEELGKGMLVGSERPSSMAKRITTPTHVAFAGVNGDFFVTQGDVGRPTGLTIENSEYAYIGSTNRRVGGIGADGKAVVASQWKYAGRVYTAKNDTLVIKHVNYTRQADELVLYNRYQGKTTGTNEYGTELLVEPAEGESWKTNGKMSVVVRQKEQQKGSMAIPEGWAVLSGHGVMRDALDTINIGDTLTIRFSLKLDGINTNLSQAIGGDNYVLIVDSGRIPQEGYWNEAHPRTGFGMSERGDSAIFCVIDGRSSYSPGCTTKVLGEVMRFYGAWRAVNWDGGGSSTLYLRNVKDQMNNGSDGSERAVGNAMFVVANVPDDDQTISILYPYQSAYSLPFCGVYTPRFLGYNKYGLLLSTDVKDVVLSCDESVGEIRNAGRTFFASTRNGGTLTATYGTATTQIEISIVPGNMELRLDTVVIDKSHPYEVEVINVNGTDRQTVAPSSITWTNLTEDICLIDEEGIVHAVSNGVGRVAAAMDNFVDTLVVLVQTADESPLTADDFADYEQWALKSMTGFNEHWQRTEHEGEESVSEVLFNYKTTRKAYILLTRQFCFFGLPDSMSIDFTTDAVIESINMSLTTADGQVLNRTLTDIPKGDAVVYQSVPLMLNYSDDRASFPLSMNYLRFYLSTETTAGEHALAMRGIRLYYKDIDDKVKVETIAARDLVLCYPNPVSDMVYVSGVKEGEMVEVFNLAGQSVMWATAGAEGAVNLSSLNSGTYLLRTPSGLNMQIIKQ